MKLWIAMLFVMLAIIAGGMYMEHHILKTTDHLSQSLDLVQEAVRNDQWLDALTLSDQISKTWSKHQKYWGPFIHNHDLDVIAGHLARLKSYLETEEKGSSLAEISVLKIQLVQLHHQEVLTLQNIF